MPRSQAFYLRIEQKCELFAIMCWGLLKKTKEFLYRWHDAIRILAKLHRIDPRSVELSGFGKPSGFYNRQLKTLGTISESQAQTIDIESQKIVGKIPYFDDMVKFFKDSTTQPKDRATLIHGDYKIDNLVFHKTEPRVIGILE